MKSQSLSMRSAMVLFLICGVPVEAQLVIDPIYTASVTNDPNAALIEADIQADINDLESDIYGNHAVTINVTVSEIATGLGDSNSAFYDTSYSSYASSLQSGQLISPVDATAIASLGGGTATNPVNGNSNISASASVLTALGTNVQGAGPLTATINAIFDFNAGLVNLSRTGTKDPTKYDLQSVAFHELDEILGTGGAGSNLPVGGGSTSGPVGTLDLYRYSAPGVRSYTTSPNVASYFSINGGVTKLVNFNQNGLADSSDFADWGNGVVPAQADGNNPPQVQDAYGTPGAIINLGSNELKALDVVGWNLTAKGLAIEAGVVPEPSTYALILGGFLMLGLFVRRQQAH